LHRTDDVSAAFEILLEEIESRVALLEKVNVRAWEERDFVRAGELVSRANTILAFREEVLQLQKKWELLFSEDINDSSAEPGATNDPEPASRQRRSGRLQRGMRTREPVFRIPILAVLMDKGGSANIGEVLNELELRMKHVLSDVDYDPLPSDPDTIRWRNTAQWSRKVLVDKGFLRNDSPRGIWEISPAGRKYLEDNQ
jgi:restriction system protein